MNNTQRACSTVVVIIACLLSSGCVAQQADVVRIKRDLDARITKLDKSKVDLQDAVAEANLALQEANGIISTQRAEIQELLEARAEVMDQVTTIKDGDLFEVRGAIDQSEHHLQSVTKHMDMLGQEVEETRQEAQVREERVLSKVEQLQQQIHQQNEVVTSQAQKISEFQGSFVDFKDALDTVRQALVDQETKLGNVDRQMVSFTSDQHDKSDVAQANWQQMKQSVDSVVSAFEQVTQTLADRLDTHERTLAQVVHSRSLPEAVSSKPERPAVHSTVADSSPAQDLRDSLAKMAPSQREADFSPPAESDLARDRLFEQQATQASLEMLDRSKIVGSQSLSRPVQQQTKPTEREVAFYQQRYEMLRAGDLQGAFHGFRQFLKEYPRSSLASNAQYWLGECYYGQGQYDQAIREFKRVMTAYPTSAKVPAALLKIGYSHLGLHNAKAARSMFRQLVRTYPKSRAATKAYARLTEVSRSRDGAS
ncbi:tol-pal system protein YbgF [Nitrospira sp. M1]